MKDSLISRICIRQTNDKDSKTNHHLLLSFATSCLGGTTEFNMHVTLLGVSLALAREALATNRDQGGACAADNCLRGK